MHQFAECCGQVRLRRRQRRRRRCHAEESFECQPELARREIRREGGKERRYIKREVLYGDLVCN